MKIFPCRVFQLTAFFVLNIEVFQIISFLKNKVPQKEKKKKNWIHKKKENKNGLEQKKNNNNN